MHEQLSKDDAIARLEEYKGSKLDKGESMAVNSIYRTMDKNGSDSAKNSIVNGKMNALVASLADDRAQNIANGSLVVETTPAEPEPATESADQVPKSTTESAGETKGD